MGDSFLAANQNTDRSVGDLLTQELGGYVRDQSHYGALMVYRLPITGALGMNIPQQYREGQWDWVVMNGGGNDLWLACGCQNCERRMNMMIRADGRAGEIPHLVMRARNAGARVLFLGYLRSPGFGSPIEHCRDEGAELETRLQRLAALVPGVDFISNADLVPPGDRTYHSWDHIHPSPKGTAEVASRVIRFIRANSPR